MSHYEQIKPQNEDKENKYKKLSCPSCNSEKIIKWCKRKTKNRELIQRYCCKDCNKKFTNNDGFFRMRNNPNKITMCLDLFYRGISTREIQQHLQAFYPKNSSWVSIYKWIVKYSNLISSYTEVLKLNTGSEIEVDEIEYNRRKHRNRKGTDKNWFIDVLDIKTRFMISSGFIKSRSYKDMKVILSKAREKTQEQISIVTTDGLNVYPKILRKTFHLNKKKAKSKIEHRILIASKDGFNHKIERLHNSIRHRTKTFRGFHGSLESANSIMKGYEIYYNFIKKHQAINKCPYELAIPDLKLSNNKWLDLINKANLLNTKKLIGDEKNGGN